MGKIIFSAVVGDARKKVGGVVFTKGHAGAVVRRKVSPTQPRSSAQRNVRASFTDFSKLWGTLSDDQRAGWIALAALYPRKDVFGQSHTLTGLQLFQSCNRNLVSIGVSSPITDPPASLKAPYPGAITVDQQPLTDLVLSGVAVSGDNAVYTYDSFTGAGPQVGANLTVTGFHTSGNNVAGKTITAVDLDGKTVTVDTTTQVDESYAAAGVIPQTLSVTPTTTTGSTAKAAVFAGAQVSAGRAFIGKKHRLLGHFTGAGPWDILALYVAKFGDLITGRKVPVLVKYITTATGAAGTPASALQPVS